MDQVYSKFASDENWRELIELFVSEVPARIVRIESAVANGNLQELQTVVHQLRGACGSYGFEGLTVLASSLDIALSAGSSLEDLLDELNEFVATLKLVTAQTPSREHQSAESLGGT